MAMTTGRFHVHCFGLSGVEPGRRRAKSLDNLWHKALAVYEAFFLDDPSRARVGIADLKSFMTADEDGAESDVGI